MERRDKFFSEEKSVSALGKRPLPKDLLVTEKPELLHNPEIESFLESEDSEE